MATFTQQGHSAIYGTGATGSGEATKVYLVSGDAPITGGTQMGHSAMYVTPPAGSGAATIVQLLDGSLPLA